MLSSITLIVHPSTPTASAVDHPCAHKVLSHNGDVSTFAISTVHSLSAASCLQYLFRLVRVPNRCVAQHVLDQTLILPGNNALAVHGSLLRGPVLDVQTRMPSQGSLLLGCAVLVPHIASCARRAHQPLRQLRPVAVSLALHSGCAIVCLRQPCIVHWSSRFTATRNSTRYQRNTGAVSVSA